MNTNARNGHSIKYFINSLKPLGWIMWQLYVIKVFPDGDGCGMIFTKWNPLSYIACALIVLTTLVIGGVNALKEAWQYNKFHFGFNGYWQVYSDKIEYISRYDRYK